MNSPGEVRDYCQELLSLYQTSPNKVGLNLGNVAFDDSKLEQLSFLNQD